MKPTSMKLAFQLKAIYRFNHIMKERGGGGDRDGEKKKNMFCNIWIIWNALKIYSHNRSNFYFPSVSSPSHYFHCHPPLTLSQSKYIFIPIEIQIQLNVMAMKKYNILGLYQIYICTHRFRFLFSFIFLPPISWFATFFSSLFHVPWLRFDCIGRLVQC